MLSQNLKKLKAVKKCGKGRLFDILIFFIDS